MHKLYAASLAAGLAGIAAAGAPALLEEVLSSRQQEQLAEAVADYWEAVEELDEVSETYEDLVEEIQDTQERVDDDLASGDLLEAVEDWERIIYLATGVDGRPDRGDVEERTYTDERFGDYTMAIHTPNKYREKDGPYPLLLCIPPKGTSAVDHLTEEWQNGGARDEYVIVACDMPTNERNWASFGTPENHGGIDTVLLSLRSVKSTHAVDVDRVFLAGFGEGVAAAADIASYYPHVFAGVVGRAGDLGDLPPANFRNLPTFFAGGGERCTAFKSNAAEMGIENVTAEAGATEEDVWAWIGEQSREPNPAEVALAPRTAFNMQSYWLRVEGFDPESGPTVHARVDAETNTIHVEADGVATITVLFNDRIVDLSQPVKLVCNGEEHEDVIPRRLKYMLENVWQSGDSGRIYVNEHRYDVPAQAD